MEETIGIYREKEPEKVVLERNQVNKIQLQKGIAVFFADCWSRKGDTGVNSRQYQAQTTDNNETFHKKWLKEKKKYPDYKYDKAHWNKHEGFYGNTRCKGKPGLYGDDDKFVIIATALEQALLVVNDLNKRFEWIFGIKNILGIEAKLLLLYRDKNTGYLQPFVPKITEEERGKLKMKEICENQEAVCVMVPTGNLYKIRTKNVKTGREIDPELIRYMYILDYCLKTNHKISVRFVRTQVIHHGGGETPSKNRKARWINLSFTLANFGDEKTCKFLANNKIKPLNSYKSKESPNPERYTKGCVFLHELLYHYSSLGNKESDRADRKSGCSGPQIMRNKFGALSGKDHGTSSNLRPQIKIPDSILNKTVDQILEEWKNKQ